MLEANDLTLAIGERQLVDDAVFAIERGEHVALVGPNGSGKTTLLETVLGNREAAGGSARLGHGVEAAYFSQQEIELDDRGSVLQCVQTMTGLQRPDAQNLLGRFLFSGWAEHEKPVSVLSGGERRRLALAVVVASGANFLVVDEPTNHLDLESREALEAALEAFPGTILLVSHDRALLDAVAERTLAIEDKHLNSYDGGWAEYMRRRDERNVPTAVTVDAPKAKPAKALRPVKKAPKGPTELERLEPEIAAGETAVAELERQLSDDWTDVETACRPTAGRARNCRRCCNDGSDSSNERTRDRRIDAEPPDRPRRGAPALRTGLRGRRGWARAARCADRVRHRSPGFKRDRRGVLPRRLDPLPDRRLPQRRLLLRARNDDEATPDRCARGRIRSPSSARS